MKEKFCINALRPKPTTIDYIKNQCNNLDNLEMSFDQVLNFYTSGNWKCCVDLFHEYPYETSKNNITIKLEGFDETEKSYLFENNTIVCQAIQEQSRSNLHWNDYMDRFFKLYSRYRSLTTIPLDLELNIVYNLLWWFCVQSKLFKHKSLYMRSILDVLSKIIAKVLKSCGEVILGQESCYYDVRRLINQLKRGSDVLLRLPQVSCMQFLDVIAITVLILLKHQNDESNSECVSFIKKCHSQLDVLKLHIQQKVISGNEEIYFKFGLASINSTASLRTWTERFDAFVITGSLVCAVNKEYKLAIDYLKQVSNLDKNHFQFLVIYMRAYCHFHLQQYNEAKLCLAYSKSCPSLTKYEGHYRLLLARLLSEQNDHQAALVHCEAVLSSQPGLVSLAAYLAATVAQNLHLSTAQLLYLNKLVQSLKPNSFEEQINLEGFEDCCFTVLCEQYSVTLHEALYSMARQLYLAGYHIKALSSYCELMELLKSDTVNCGSAKWLPQKVQILHETVLAHIKANDLKGGEQLCRQLIREYVPTRAKKIKDEYIWEPVLYRFEDDIVSMALLADILVHSDKKKALDELNRCYNAVMEFQELASSQGNLEHLKELCDWLMSRILMRKAKLSNVDEATHYFRRALIHKPGDKEVVFYYKQWALWHPDHESFDPGDRVVEFPVNQLHNLALSHILGCSVSDEEWAALCDQESSRNVLESLFDDDD